MYWTKIVRSFCKIVMVLGIIASIISGIVISDDSVLIGLVVIIGGSAVSVISISFIMMLSEMSLTLDEMNNKMYKITQNDNKDNSKSNSVFNEKSQPPIKTARGNSWKCVDCGNINPAGAKFCRECGHLK